MRLSWSPQSAGVWLFGIVLTQVGPGNAGEQHHPSLLLNSQFGQTATASPGGPTETSIAPLTPALGTPPVDPGVFPENQGGAPAAAESSDSNEDCDWCNLGDAWTLKDAWAKSRCLEADDLPFTIAGWTQFGYTNRSDGVFNTVPDSFNLHQGYLYIERAAKAKDDGAMGFGFRADLVYGIDAANTQAFGNHPGRFDYQNGWDHGQYGWAMPQLFADFAWEKTSVKVGHFYTLMGYEVVTAPGNFFYSHAFTMNFGEAFTHTGTLATHKVNDKLTVYGGWTLGWDTGFDQLNGGSNFLGGASYAVTDTLTATYVTTAGKLGWLGEGYAHTFVMDKKFTDDFEKFNYVFQSDLVNTNLGVFGGTTYHTIGINQYLFYTVNECVKAGVRAEWWKADGVSYNEITGGVNIRPHANLVIRPELRYQWSPAGANPVGIPEKQTIFGLDMILTF